MSKSSVGLNHENQKPVRRRSSEKEALEILMDTEQTILYARAKAPTDPRQCSACLEDRAKEKMFQLPCKEHYLCIVSKCCCGENCPPHPHRRHHKLMSRKQIHFSRLSNLGLSLPAVKFPSLLITSTLNPPRRSFQPISSRATSSTIKNLPPQIPSFAPWRNAAPSSLSTASKQPATAQRIVAFVPVPHALIAVRWSAESTVKTSVGRI